MTEKDMDGLFDLLKLYFPNSPKTGSNTLKKAWLLILEPYGRGDVKQALLKLLRANEHFPDPQKIAALCPPLQEHARRRDNPLSARDDHRYMDPLRKRHGVVMERRKKAGIPTAAGEANRPGLSPEEFLFIMGRSEDGR